MNMKIYERWINFNKSKLSPGQLSNSPNLDALHKVGIELHIAIIHTLPHLNSNVLITLIGEIFQNYP